MTKLNQVRQALDELIGYDFKIRTINIHEARETEEEQ